MSKVKTYSLTIFLTLSFGLFSCSNSTNKKEIYKTKIHERLIDCKTKYVMEDGEKADGYHENYENFIKDYFSEYLKGYTYRLTTLIEVNACGKTIGNPQVA